MISLLDGEYLAAVQYHPLGPCLTVGFLGFFVAVSVAVFRRSTPIIETRVFSALILALAITGVSLWGVRGLVTCRVGLWPVSLEVR